MSFHKMIEDPMYDEDGNCIDEDFEWDDSVDLDDLADQLDNYDPYSTVNS